jgi:hypothetical protein
MEIICDAAKDLFNRCVDCAFFEECKVAQALRKVFRG